ncbi:ribonuclease III (plasmid) [Sphingomonas paeninsulae]|jgi:ribonuclease-3|uniref:Ribonuclease 3 n=1 Tax=Sphingomonas paeninsulae TaxID=2319844 RepID=A0A494T7F2_SPHPE|nr:ribonuclease III [Sphingomonas paeninsulae]AYJ84810.1 ribonuclease III [Sphingomonas paeninsulae]
MGFGGTLEPDRGRFLTALSDWLTVSLGIAPRDIGLYERALSHGSAGSDSYQRLEFLGDRVLGLAVSRWLYATYPAEPEGQLSRRFNSLVTGVVCADVARGIGVAPYLKLGKQARDDGAFDSDNILGDVTEALIGALYLDHGFDAADAFVRMHWRDLVEGHADAPRHPKSALQEWAAANNRRAPVYAIVDRSGPHHAPRFTVSVNLGPAGEASATGSSKQEAETAAAVAMLEKLKG